MCFFSLQLCKKHDRLIKFYVVAVTINSKHSVDIIVEMFKFKHSTKSRVNWSSSFYIVKQIF